MRSQSANMAPGRPPRSSRITSTPVEALSELVAALRATTWSSWQTTARFDPALAVAEAVLERERLRDAAPELLEMLKTIKANAGDPESVYRIARDAIAAADHGGAA